MEVLQVDGQVMEADDLQVEYLLDRLKQTKLENNELDLNNVLGVCSGDDEYSKMLLSGNAAVQGLQEFGQVVGEFELEEDMDSPDSEEKFWAGEYDDFDDEDEEEEDEFGRSRGSFIPTRAFLKPVAPEVQVKRTEKKAKVRFSEWEQKPGGHNKLEAPLRSNLKTSSSVIKNKGGSKPTTTRNKDLPAVGESTNSIMKDCVVERHHIPIQSYDEVEEFNSKQHQFEIAREYHRLRSKMIQAHGNGFKSDDSEVIDKEGYVIPKPTKKVSRFKAARLDSDDVDDMEA